MSITIKVLNYKSFLIREMPFLILVFSLLASNIEAIEYFVSTPEEITSKMAIAIPGDTLTMTNGVWTDAHIVFEGNGTEDQPILLRSESPGYVILSGSSNLRIAGDYLIVDGLYFKNGYSSSGSVIEFRNGSGNLSNYCRLTNTAIENYNPTNASIGYKWVSLYGSHNRVDHCYFKGKNHIGTTLVVWFERIKDPPAHYHLIDHNYFAHRPELGENDGETIRIGTSGYSMLDSYTIVEHNYFEYCNGEIEIISNKSCENIYRYNTFFECEGAMTLRHGNRCTVESNFFIGNRKSLTGGVRVIGEDHKIINNYFCGLYGSSFKSALPIVNGVPNSPLNRYFQVKRALIAFNTFVDCKYTMIIGAGADDERTLPPEDCIIANNLVKTNYQVIRQDAEPINMTWEGNIMQGSSLGIPQPEGITIIDPQLVLAEDSLWRPAEFSPAIGAAMGDYDFVVDDMDGQSRIAIKDVGADQNSDEPILRRPLSPSDVGPDWYPAPPRITQVAAGEDSLLNAVAAAYSGDILELVTDGGVYTNNGIITIGIPLTIRSMQGLSSRPIIKQTNASISNRTIFEIQNGGSLILDSLELDGIAATDSAVKYLIVLNNEGSESSILKVENCYLHDVEFSDSSSFFKAYQGSFSDTIIFSNCLLKNCDGEGISMIDEEEGSMLYNVDYFELSNCTFWNIKKEAIHIYAGDNVIFTPGPKIRVNHCTFDNCGYANYSVINAREVDYTQIKNSIFSNGSKTEYSVKLYGFTASIAYCDTFEIGPVQLNRSAQIGDGMIDADPLYADRFNGDFTLAQNSPAWFAANDGQALGDLRWATDPPQFVDEQSIYISESFKLQQNYPNPFNSSTRISYTLLRSAFVEVQIFDLRGSLIARFNQQEQSPGEYAIDWQASDISSGVYICRLQVNDQSKMIKIVFVK